MELDRLKKRINTQCKGRRKVHIIKNIYDLWIYNALNHKSKTIKGKITYINSTRYTTKPICMYRYTYVYMYRFNDDVSSFNRIGRGRYQ